MLRCKRFQSVFFVDTMFGSKHKCVKINKHCQVFVIDKDNIDILPMRTQEKFETALHWFCKEVVVLVDLVLDGFSTQNKLSVKQFCNQVGNTLNTLERSNQ